MTSAEFLAFYPQFTGLFPAGVLAEYIRRDVISILLLF